MKKTLRLFVHSICWLVLLPTPAKAGKTKIVRLSAVRPASYCPPAHVKTLSIVSRPQTEDANELVSLLHDDMARLAWFNSADLARSQLEFNQWRLKPIGQRVAKQICKTVDSDGLLILESLTTRKGQHIVASETTSSLRVSSSPSLPMLAATFSSTTKDTKAKSVHTIDAATAHWGMYSCDGEVLTSVRVKGTTLTELNGHLIRHIHATKTPPQNRTLMFGPGVNRQHGYKYWRLGDYPAAAKAWSNAANDLRGQNKVQALNNAAIALEVSGKHSNALKTAQSALDLVVAGRLPYSLKKAMERLVEATEQSETNAKAYKEQRRIRAGMAN